MYARRWIAILFAASGTLLVGNLAWRRLPAPRNSAGPRARWARQRTSRIASFVTSQGVWLTVNIPHEATHVRVMSNAALREGAPPPALDASGRSGWQYAIGYELVGRHGDVIDRGQYHFRTRITLFLPSGGGTPESETFFANSKYVACDTRSLLYPLARYHRDARWLRLRVASRDADIHDVAVRVYYRHERPRFSSRFAWFRLSRDRRNQLCRALAYPARLTTRYERRNLLHWQWTPAMPIGVEGRDYTRRFLYRMEDVSGVEVGNGDAAGAPVADADRYVTFPVPVGPGDVRLDFGQAVTYGRTGVPRTVQIQWFGHGLRDREQTQISFTPPRGRTVIPTDGGLIQVAAAHRISVRATWRARDARVEDRGETLVAATRLRTYHCTHDIPVEYRIAHLENRATPFRVVVRIPFESESTRGQSGHGAPRSGALRWSLHARDGQTLDAGTLLFSATRSSYDWIDSGVGTVPVSDSTSWYFSVPADADTIRFHAGTGRLLIAGYTRPPRLSRTTRVPEEYSPFRRRKAIGRAWFSIEPERCAARVADNQTAAVSLQIRPPKNHVDLLAGQYRWTRYDPRGLWKARRLLVPAAIQPMHRSDDRTDGRPRRGEDVIESMAGIRSGVSERTYSELIADTDLHVAPGENQTRTRFRPILVFSGLYNRAVTGPELGSGSFFGPLPVAADPDSNPKNVPDPFVYPWNTVSPRERLHRATAIRITLDGNTYFAGKITSRRGRLTLPPWPQGGAGEHVMRITTDRPLRLFVKRLRVAGARLFIGRLAHRLDDGGIRIPYEKTSAGEEIVQLRVFRDASDAGRATLRVTIGGIERRTRGPLDAWTVADHVYDLAPEATSAALVLDGSEETIGPGHVCFVRFGRDLPAGPYTLDLDYNGSMAYVVVSRTVAGQAPPPMVQVAYRGDR